MILRSGMTLGLCVVAMACQKGDVAESAARAVATNPPAAAVPVPPAANPAAAPTPGEMVSVPAGTFMMGSTTSDYVDGLPLHQVTLSAYSIDAHTVTNTEYLACETASACTAPGLGASSSRPNYHTDPTFGAFPWST